MMLGDARNRDRALQHIYSLNKEKVSSFVLANSGSQAQAEDVFQDAVIAFYENVRNGKFKEESTLSTYLYSITRFKWLNQLKKDSIRARHNETYEGVTISESHLVEIIDGEKKDLVLMLLTKLGATCKSILIESVYHNASMKEIAALGNFSSEQVVRNKKYKCIKKLNEHLQAQPDLIKLLKGYE